MARVAVVGGSVTGLWTALTLVRAGHDVTVFERDPAPPADVTDAALRWERPGTPQLRQSHAFVARAVRLLRDEAPDLLDDLAGLGAHLSYGAEHLPPWVDDRAPRDGDDALVTLSARRPVFDKALHDYALRNGVRVAARGASGFTVTDGEVPHVTGVGLADGSAYAADVVVDATGRRSRAAKWLGVTFPETGNECGNRYHTRYYEVLPGATPPPLHRGFASGGEVDACAVLVFLGDGATFSVSVQSEDDDEGFRVLRDPAAFDEAVRPVPWVTPWLEAARPLGDPVVMAGQRNVLRRAAVAGRPVATGVMLTGDAVATSNPAYGRGVSLAMLMAGLVRDALEHADAGDRVLALDEAVAREVGPFIRNAAEVDARTRARWRTRLYGEAPLPEPEAPTFEDLLNAAMRDRDLWTALASVAGVLRPPDEVLGDAAVAARVAERNADGWTPPTPPLPARDEMLARAAAAAS